MSLSTASTSRTISPAPTTSITRRCAPPSTRSRRSRLRRPIRTSRWAAAHRNRALDQVRAPTRSTAPFTGTTATARWRPTTGSTTNPAPAKPRLDLNQPGAALGGRIIRDKLFFYANYELFRNKQQSSRLRTVLTDSARNGIFTYRDTAGNLQTVNLSSLRNFITDPTIKAMIAQLPAPNATGRRRRTQHHGLPLQRPLERVPRPVRLQERLLSELEAQLHRHLQLHQQPHGPSGSGQRSIHRSRRSATPSTTTCWR